MNIVNASPGVRFQEIDLTLNVRQPNNNTVYMAGFAAQGPTYAPNYVTSIADYESVFGMPTNAAERYLYHSARQILLKTPASLLITRLPYEPLFLQFNDKKATTNVLAYPIITDNTDNIQDIDAATTYTLLEPVDLFLTTDEYAIIKKNGFNWDYRLDLRTASNGFPDSLSAVPIGLIITNDANTSFNNLFEGMYISVSDNSEADPSLGYSCVTGVKTYDASSAGDVLFYPLLSDGTLNAPESYSGYSVWNEINPNRFTFKLSDSTLSAGISDTISETIIKSSQGYMFEDPEYSDSLIISVFGLNRSTNVSANVQLQSTYLESFTGSLNQSKVSTDSSGGAAKSTFLENKVNSISEYISVYINPALSHQVWEDNVTSTFTNLKKVRVTEHAKNLYSTGIFTSINKSPEKSLGYIPGKLRKALDALELPEAYPLDITCDAGLSTIWTTIAAKNFDFITPTIEDDIELLDTTFNDEHQLGHSKLNPTASGNPTIKDLHSKVAISNIKRDAIVQAHNEIANMFVELASTTRRDHIHFSDPLRQIFIEGRDFKQVNRDKDSNAGPFNFSEEMYWPLYNIFSNISTSYVASYPNWFKVSDTILKRGVWIPPSAVIAANVITTSPFEAPAGFTRGIITGISDIAVSPTQKQRDLLYKISMNSVTTFPGEGTIIYGQKTLFNRPSAFDRLNVRRTFLYLEKLTNAAAKYFVFEANTFFTRSRVVSVLTPLYEFAKKNSGIYDYKIICNESNNTPFTIDNNELIIDIYIKPVRTAEFILVNFYATRTDQNFSELIG